MPYWKTLFLPWMSAILPRGIRNIAAARMYEMVTQLNVTASRLNSLAIVGRAIFTEDPMKVTVKEAVAAARSATLWVVRWLSRLCIRAIIACPVGSGFRPAKAGMSRS